MEKKENYRNKNIFRICIAVIICIILAFAIETVQNNISEQHQYTESKNTLQDISATLSNNTSTADALKDTYHSCNTQLLDDLKNLMSVESPNYVFQDLKESGPTKLSGLSDNTFLSYLFLCDDDGNVVLSKNDINSGFNLVQTGFFSETEFKELITNSSQGVLCYPEDAGSYYFYSTEVEYLSKNYNLIIGNEADVLLKQVSSLTNFSTIISNTSLQEGSFILTLDPSTNVITYCSDSDMDLTGKTAEESELDFNLFSDVEYKTLKINGEKYICVMLKYSSDCMLVEAVSSAYRYSNNYKPTLWAMLLLVMMLVVMICYIMNLPSDLAKKGEEDKLVHLFKSKFVISLTQLKKILPILLIGILLIFGCVFYCRTILRLSWEMTDVERPLTQLSTELKENEKIRDEVQEYCGQMYVSKGQTISSMIEIDPACLNEETTKVHTEYDKDGVKKELLDDEGNSMTSIANSSILQSLCDSNDIKSIQIYNEQGYVIASSNSNWSFTLSLNSEDQSYAFRQVLDGKVDYLVQDAGIDDEGNQNQYIGVAFTYYTTKDNNGNTKYVSSLDYENYKNGNWNGNPITEHNSMLQFAVDPNITEDMLQSTDLTYIMEHISLSDDAYMVVFDDSADHRVVYTPNTQNIGKTAAELNVSDNEFSGDFNGFQTVAGIRYFECCRYEDGYYVAVATPTSTIYSSRLSISLTVTLLCLLVTIIIMGLFMITSEEEMHARALVNENSDFVSINSFARKTGEEKIHTIVQYFIVIIGLYFLLGLISGNLLFADSNVVKYVLSDKWERGLNIFAFTKSVAVMVIVLLGVKILDWFTNLIVPILSRDAKTIIHLIMSFVRYGIVIVAIFYCLYLFGLQPMSLLASAGVISIIVGLGAQSLIADFLAGIFIVFEGSFHVGDLVVIDGTWGYVEEIGIRTTKIRDLDNCIAVFNNNDIKNILNVSVKRNLIRIDYSITYEGDLERIEKILKEELPHFKERIPELLEGPYYDNVTKLNNSSVDIRVNVYCKGSDRLAVTRKINREFLLMCHRNGIDIPYPHVTINYNGPEDKLNKN